jgi:type I restriction enzyme S subunit
MNEKLIDILHGCVFADGDWIESKDQDPDGEVRLIQLADIGDGVFIDKSRRFINKITAERLKCTYLQKGDVLIARMPDPLGRACIFPLDGHNKYVTAVDVCIIRVGVNITNKYLTYAINSQNIRNTIASQKTGTTRERITRKKLGQLEIPLPPLPVQKKIAEILDAADILRQKDKALLEKYTELTQALFLDMFGDPVSNPKGWELSPLSEYINIKHGFAFKSEHFTDRGKYVLLTPGNFYERGGYRDQGVKQKYFSGDFPVEYLLKAGEILIAMTEQVAGLLGSAIIVPSSEQYLHNQRLGLVQARKEIDPLFLCSLFNHVSVRTQIHHSATGTKVRHTSPTKLTNIKVGIPPLSDQRQFARCLDNIKQQINFLMPSQVKSDELFNSLLQKAFKGELV